MLLSCYCRSYMSYNDEHHEYLVLVLVYHVKAHLFQAVQYALVCFTVLQL